MYKYRLQTKNQDYWKFPEKGYPKTINWDIVSGPPDFRLNQLMDHDIILDEYDYKIRRMNSETEKFIKYVE